MCGSANDPTRHGIGVSARSSPAPTATSVRPVSWRTSTTVNPHDTPSVIAESRFIRRAGSPKGASRRFASQPNRT